MQMELDTKTLPRESRSSLCVRRIMILHDNLQFDEANMFISKLSSLTFSRVIRELPMDSLIATFPASIKILEILFTRFHHLDEHLRSDIAFGDVLKPDRLVINLVKLFALQKPFPMSGRGLHGLSLVKEKFNSDHPVVISSKKILRVIMIHQPTTLRDLASRKASLDEALQGLSNHGLVGAADQSLTSLHEALRLEIASAIDNFKDILLRLENLKESGNQTKKAAILRSISRATSMAVTNRLNPVNYTFSAHIHSKKDQFHQKVPNLKLEELQNRLISNQVLLNMVEPITISNQPLQELILTLQQRINYDKQVLSQFNQLRKEFNAKRPRASGSLNESISSIHPVLSLFAFGYNQVLNLISDTLPSNEHLDGYGILFASRASSSIINEAEKVKTQKELNCEDVVIDNDVKNRSGLDAVNPTTHFTLNSHRKYQCGTIIHRPEYQKHRQIIHLFESQHTKDLESSMTQTSCSKPSSSIEITTRETEIIEQNVRKQVNTDRLHDNNSYDDLDQRLLKNQLIEAHKMIDEMKKREQQLENKLSDQTQKMLLKGWRPDNLCFNEKRPTALIRRYGNLYAQARVDTLDALDNLLTLKHADDLKAKLLFSLVVLSFCSVEQSLTKTKQQVRRLLKITNDRMSIANSTGIDGLNGIDEAITTYLRLAIDTFDPRDIVEEVLSQICTTLYDYPCLRNCDGLLMYIKDCVTLAWALIIQSPPFTIEYGCQTFDDTLHKRFHTSNQSSNMIKCYLWPSLLEAPKGPCVHKGVVIT